MRNNDPTGAQLEKRSTRIGMLVVFLAALILAATTLILSYFSQQGLREESSRRAESHMAATKDQILQIIDQAELVVRNNLWITSWALDFPDTLHLISKRILEDNDVIVGSTVALVPGYLKSRTLFAPYYYKDVDSLRFRSLATPEYDYPHQEWFCKPLEVNGGYWSEPYIDEGGGDMLMTTYSYPVKDTNGQTAAVLTADISLGWLSELVGEGKVYPHAINIILSREGRLMVSPLKEDIMLMNVSEVVSQMKDSLRFKEVERAMLAGEAGSAQVWFRGEDCTAYYAPVERTGWSMCILIPHDDIFGASRRIRWIVRLFQLLGLIMLALIIRSFIRNRNRYQELNEREKKMEGELRGARGIQMSMVPQEFPPFPERHDLDLAATLVPAREVGGDLYDFFIRDEKLFFCIGDVSGKGIPASLVMAVTRTTFRNVSIREDSPGRIVSEMNNNLASMNDNCLFVTFFCGVLNLKTGQMRYCNAGHNPPIYLSDAIRFLPVEPNIALGIMKGMVYTEQEILMYPDDAIFLYTDGLNEAENAEHEQFGEERMENALHGRKASQEHLETILGQVAHFVGEAPQSDDLTMLFIHYLGKDSTAPRKLTLHNNICEISRLYGFVEAIADEGGLDPALTASINLALEEAVTNVIEYAYPNGTDGTVDVEAYLGPKILSFTISDSGMPFDPTARAEVDTTAGVEERPIGGLGIHLIRRIMDSVKYKRKNGMNILTITKNL